MARQSVPMATLLKSLLDFALMITLGNVLEEYRMYKCERERNGGGEKHVNHCAQAVEQMYSNEVKLNSVQLLKNKPTSLNSCITMLTV